MRGPAFEIRLGIIDIRMGLGTPPLSTALLGVNKFGFYPVRATKAMVRLERMFETGGTAMMHYNNEEEYRIVKGRSAWIINYEIDEHLQDERYDTLEEYLPRLEEWRQHYAQREEEGADEEG